MHHGPKRRVVQRVLVETLSRIRRYGECDEDDFAEAVRDLPAILRNLADALDSPPEAFCQRPEAPALEGYALWAENYDEETDNEVVVAEESVIWKVIGDVHGIRVLDVGCGTGRHTVRLAAQGASVVALDPTPEMLSRAQEKAIEAGVDLDLRLGGLDDLAPDVGTFDLVVCCLVLSHVEDLAGAVATLSRHVGPGSRLIVSDFHPVNVLLGYRTVLVSGGTTYIVPNYLHPISEYFAAVTEAGLTVTQLLEPGEWDRLPGVPPALVLEAIREGARTGHGNP